MSERSSAQDQNPYADKSVREIEEEIARTREALSRDLDELGGYLSPERFAAQARDAVQRAQDVALKGTHELSEKLLERTSAGGAGLIATLQRHALPVTLVGLGVTVLAMGRGDKTPSRVASKVYRDRRTVVVSPQGGGIHTHGAGPSNPAASPSTPQRSKKGRRKGLGGLIDQHPVAAGAATVVAGLLVGLALPTQEPELPSPQPRAPRTPRISQPPRMVRARRA